MERERDRVRAAIVPPPLSSSSSECTLTAADSSFPSASAARLLSCLGGLLSLLLLLLLLRLDLFLLSSSSSLLSDCAFCASSVGFHSNALSRRLRRVGERLTLAAAAGEAVGVGETGCGSGSGCATVVVVRRRVRDAIDCVLGAVSSAAAGAVAAPFFRVARLDMPNASCCRPSESCRDTLDCDRLGRVSAVTLQWLLVRAMAAGATVRRDSAAVARRP